MKNDDFLLEKMTLIKKISDVLNEEDSNILLDPHSVSSKNSYSKDENGNDSVMVMCLIMLLIQH